MTISDIQHVCVGVFANVQNRKLSSSQVTMLHSWNDSPPLEQTSNANNIQSSTLINIKQYKFNKKKP